MLLSRLQLALLLAAACLVMASVPPPEKATTCEGAGNVQHLKCAHGVIIVESVLYGRANSETCSEGQYPEQLSDTSCSLSGAEDIVKESCNGLHTCEIKLDVFNTYDPCVGTYKYLETLYNCVPALCHISCEGSEAHLFCPPGQVIKVYGAFYGRRDQSTCIFGRPEQQVQNIHCSNPTDKVAYSCNGQNSCTITVRNSVFGEPCGGTYKYLEVSYICEYPAVYPDDGCQIPPQA